MGAETNAGPVLAHVLFMDIVGCSKRPSDEQKKIIGRLQALVRESGEYQRSLQSDRLISLPTGDGMALAFFNKIDAAVLCAIEIMKAIQAESLCEIRMGIHSGPVFVMEDINGKRNISGAGINSAERVMSCSESGHILLSDNVAASLRELSQFRDKIHEVGECQVKDGWVRTWTLVDGSIGNAKLPQKSKRNLRRRRMVKVAGLVAMMLALIGLVASGTFVLMRVGTTKDGPSIAVLPFRDISPEKNQEYFSEGLAEDLLNALAKIKGLHVAARSSSFQFSGKAQDTRAIANILRVAAILEGSVRQHDNQARINVELIQADNGFQLWSETYNTKLNDILDVQERIALAVAGALRVTLLGEKAAGPAKPTVPAAYNAYLQGRYFLERHNGKENLDKAAAYFEQAIKSDPGYARTWVGLSEARNGLASAGFYLPQEEGYLKAREAVEHALVLDPNLGEAYSALGWIQMMNDWNWAGADASFKRALALEPGNATVISHAGILARIVGRLDEAVALGRQGMQLDPLRSGVYQNAGVSLYYAGLHQEAAAAFRKALELVPDLQIAHCLLGEVYLAQFRPREALAEMEKEKRTELRLFGLALAYHALGMHKESDRSLSELVDKYGGPPYQIAQAYAYRGENDHAFEWLERAYNAHGLSQLKGDPLFKSLEHDPRHTALLKKMHV